MPALVGISLALAVAMFVAAAAGLAALLLIEDRASLLAVRR